MSKVQKRKYFKVLDPVVQRDLYKWLGILWCSWVIGQSAFLFAFNMIEKQVAQEHKALVAFVLFFIFSSVLFLFTLISMGNFVNKFIGPIHRMREELLKAKKENTQISFKLRDDDYFQDIADHLNEMKFK